MLFTLKRADHDDDHTGDQNRNSFDPSSLRLLKTALVRPGGRVVYSTCTLIAPENEDVVAAAGAPLDDLAARFPGYAHPRLPGALLTLPHRHGTDGFFIARLRRPEDGS